jgi:hypothetical protein
LGFARFALMQKPCCSLLTLPPQASFAFNVLEEALRLILEKMEDLSSLAAETARLAGLLAALRAADVDAGGDGTVIGFGSAPKHRSSSGGGSSGAADTLPGSKGSDGFDVELAERSETASLLHGSNGNSSCSNTGVHHMMAGGVSDEAAAGPARLSRVLRLMDGSVPGLSVEGLSACVPGRHHQATVVCQDLSFTLEPGEGATWGPGLMTCPFPYSMSPLFPFPYLMFPPFHFAPVPLLHIAAQRMQS